MGVQGPTPCRGSSREGREDARAPLWPAGLGWQKVGRKEGPGKTRVQPQFCPFLVVHPGGHLPSLNLSVSFCTREQRLTASVPSAEARSRGPWLSTGVWPDSFKGVLRKMHLTTAQYSGLRGGRPRSDLSLVQVPTPNLSDTSHSALTLHSCLSSGAWLFLSQRS